MRKIIVGFIAAVAICFNCNTSEAQEISRENLDLLISMPLKCMEKEYPNKLSQVLSSDDDLKSPRDLHPVFYGCFDWHSALHGHWMLLRLLRSNMDHPRKEQIVASLNQRLKPENFKAEVEYFLQKENKSFERTYGWAWLLKFAAELNQSELKEARVWQQSMKELEELIVSKYKEFLPKLSYPIRSGEHPNTAFGLALAWDYASVVGEEELKVLIEKRAKDFYMEDRGCPISWEPSGFDFLSPCLQEAALMKRILDGESFNVWFNGFLPGLMLKGKGLLSPAKVLDRSDGKLVHLDGLNLSRAWCLYEIADGNDMLAQLIPIANTHFDAGFKKIKSGEYSGEHWLASFAVYALEAGGKLNRN